MRIKSRDPLHAAKQEREPQTAPPKNPGDYTIIAYSPGTVKNQKGTVMKLEIEISGKNMESLSDALDVLGCRADVLKSTFDSLADALIRKAGKENLPSYAPFLGDLLVTLEDEIAILCACIEKAASLLPEYESPQRE